MADKENIPPAIATAVGNTAGPAAAPVASKKAKKSKVCKRVQVDKELLSF